MAAWRAALLALCAAPPAQAAEVWCILNGMMLTMTEARAQLDYLGDGTFDVSPATPRPGFGFQRTDLTTAGGDIPIFLDERDCVTIGVTWPITVELAVRSANGPRIYSGCCRWQDPT